MSPSLLTVAKVAKTLNYTVQHTRLLMRQNKLPAVKVGRDWLIDGDVFKKLKQNTGKTDASMINKTQETAKPTVVSLFSGCGGMDIGFRNAGFDVVWANDINQYACETYRKYLGDHIVPGSIEDIPLKDIPKADVVVGGFPCQDFSIIWKQPGLEGKRGSLYLSFVEVVRHVQPKVFVAENVRGLMTLDKGKILERIVADFKAAGYTIRVDLYNFAEYGVPQIRERVLIVGVRDNLKAVFNKPAPTNSKDDYVSSKAALRGVSKIKQNNERINISQKTKEMLQMIPPGGNFTSIPKDHKLYVKGMISHVYRRLHPDKPSMTIIAAGGGGTWGYHYKAPRPLTNRERARLFTFPDDMIFYGSVAEVRRQIGNAVPPKGVQPVAESIKCFLENGYFH